METSVKIAALALGVATLSAATILPASAKCIMSTILSEADCGSTAGGVAAATMGSVAIGGSAASVAFGNAGDTSAESSAGHVIGGEYVPNQNTSSITHNLDANHKTAVYSDGDWTSSVYDPKTNTNETVIYNNRTGTTTIYERNYNTGVTITTTTGGGHAGKAGAPAVPRVGPLSTSEAAPTATVSPNVFGGVVKAYGGAVSSASLGRPVSQTVPAPKKPVTVGIATASTQAQATMHQPAAQPFGPVGSSSMNARQAALSAGRR